MQKKIIALAVAALASTAAFAQSNVTIYGRADLGGMYRDGSSGGAADVEGKYEMASGIQAGSRIGFKGVEDLGNGLKAVFEMEYGMSMDQNTGGNKAATWTNRHSYVGLTGGFGTVVGGHLDGVRYGVYNTYDPFAGGTIANFTQMTIQVDRASNAIAYISPKFSGFGLVLAYGTAIDGIESPGNNADNALQTIMATYDNGPISARLDYEQVVPSGADGKAWVATAGASYDFGMVKLSALLDMIKSDIGGSDFEEQGWLIGAKAPVGKFDLKAMVGGVRTKGTTTFGGVAIAAPDDADSIKWGLGLDYNLSKRTNLYANYGQIHNDDGAARTITPAANSNAGYGTVGFDLGIAHKF